jgi:hypothetical protein
MVNTIKQEMKVEQMTAASCFAGDTSRNERHSHHMLRCGIKQNTHRSGLGTGATQKTQRSHQMVGKQQLLFGATEPWLRTQPCQTRMKNHAECDSLP